MILWFLFCSLVCYKMYDFFPFKPPKRPMYVIKNIYKSLGLCVLFVVALPIIIIPAFVNDEWNTKYIHVFGSMYVCHDLVGLFRVPNLQLNTRLHHVATVVLLLVSYQIDFQTSSLGQAMFVYTVCSAASFIVNLYLAMRYLGIFLSLRVWSFYIYLFSCTINWIWHVRWAFSTTFTRWHYFYVVLLGFIIFDDIVLLLWLSKKNI